MTPGRLERVKEILLRVVDLPAAERQAVLDEACAGDPELRADVEDLLAIDPRGTADSASARSADSASAPTAPSDGAATKATNAPPAQFTSSQVLGSRYRMVKLLGRGGMGEVWQAWDVKLLVDVALKSVRAELFPGEQGLELLRREVRAAREVISPNVCRIFDLVDEDGQEFVSMEYVDGQTLLAILRERGPLDIQEATRIASQLLAGLEAIHQAGLVHRDIKPENVMITRTGRVVLMDFGIAKGIGDDQWTVIAGTPAYMAPEQARGEVLDARADIFAAGVVLAEMIAPAGVREHETRQSIWQAVRQLPVRLFESPWRTVLERAVADGRERRYASARELARALEEVALRDPAAEDRRPYPGLESFTEADAEFFFGREIEVEAAWKKLQRTNLLAIMGPSGAGKTSFLRAGLLPARPEGWEHVLVRPGASPFAALARAVAPSASSSLESVYQPPAAEVAGALLGAVSRWRAEHMQVLLVLDQFEELFTLVRPDVQAAFTELLGRIADEGDVHVLLVMRDDFLFRCHDHPALAPIFSDLTPLGPPTGSSLRRALVQPALLNGYRFEDESLADEMLRAIEGERGALPLLAFAAARLWEQRDRERGLLTRAAYERIGGVSGALAQHAEATLERVGGERLPVVRELFRNLVTAQGTRAVADVDELLSVFPDREAAGAVLRELVNARLLTSFELPASRKDRRERHRVEIVHESLLASWPRLVHWQTQDMEGAQLRDQLRQAAQLWRERGESPDLLWTGTAFREFALWRERYPGGLTATEEAYARAMVARAERQRRRRRRIVAGTIAALVVVAAAMTTFGIRARVAQRHAEANQLLALGQTRIEHDPAAALAYAAASVERADSPAARRFAVEALSRGPSAISVALSCSSAIFQPYFLDFSPDGKRLAVGGTAGVQVIHGDGSPPSILEDYTRSPITNRAPVFAPDGDHVVWPKGEGWSDLRVWSMSEGRLTRTLPMGGQSFVWRRANQLWFVPNSYRAPTSQEPGDPGAMWWSLRSWGRGGEEIKLVCPLPRTGMYLEDMDRSAQRLAFSKEREVYTCAITGSELGAARLVGECAASVSAGGSIAFDPTGERLASQDASGEIRLWPVAGSAPSPSRTLPRGGRHPAFGPTGKVLAATSDQDICLWDLDGPADTEPFVLRRGDGGPMSTVAFDPSGQWAAVGWHNEIVFWPLTHSRPYVLRGAKDQECSWLAFTPAGKSLLGVSEAGSKIWDLEGAPTREGSGGGGYQSVVLDPRGRFVVVGTLGGAAVIPMTGEKWRRLPNDGHRTDIGSVTISPDGKLAAGCIGGGAKDNAIRVWDLDANTVRFLESSEGGSYCIVQFSPDGSLIAGDMNGAVTRWDIDKGTGSVLATGKGMVNGIQQTPDARLLFVLRESETTALSETWTSELTCYELANRTSRVITTHGNKVWAFALDPAGTLLATTSHEGMVQVGPIGGGEPHLLPAPIQGWSYVVFSPDGRWVAAGAVPGAYLWRVPQGQPFQTLPRAEFLERARALTYLRAVPDKKSSTGYRLDRAPFTGWEQVPTW
jgi:WD40 repeat protein